MNNFSFAPERTIGNASLIGTKAADRLTKSNYRVDANIDEEEVPQQQANFDISFLNKFVDEVNNSIKQTHEFRQIVKNYKMATSKFSKSAENDFLTNLIPEKKNQIFRDISRIFDQQDEALAMKDKLRKIMTYKLEDTRRNLVIKNYFIPIRKKQILNKNRANRDIFDMFQKKDLPMDLRQLIWKISLENVEETNAYSKRLNQGRLLTMSKLDVQIIKDTELMVSQMTQPDLFDGTMIFAMKTILSYYEIKKDRVLVDYLYLIAIPLVYTFGSLKHLLKIPSELVGYFISLQQMVQFFDPLVDLIIKHDEAYDAQMTDLFMNSLSVLDEQLAEKIHVMLNLSQATQRTLLVLIIKRFVHSLGFAFLSIKTTLYVWDQIIMKIVKNRLEIFVVMAITFFCLREQMLTCTNWDKMVDLLYTEAKNIQFEVFKGYYLEVFKNVKFYISPYSVDPRLVNRNTEFVADPMAKIADEQMEKDVESYKRKWFEGKEYYDDTEDQKLVNSSTILPKDKASAIKQMKMEEVMRNVQIKNNNQKPSNLGMVPIREDLYDNHEDIFDGLE